MLMRNERLARLETRYDDSTQILTILREGKPVTRAEIGSPMGRSILEQFFAAFMREELRGPPKVLSAPENFRFTDSKTGFVSLINMASVRDVARVLNVEVDPLRFRGNILLEGLEPWQEFDFVGKSLRIGKAELTVTKRTERCAATNVNPVTAARDLNIPNSLMRAFGHVDCGIYAKITEGGDIAVQDKVALI